MPQKEDGDEERAAAKPRPAGAAPKDQESRPAAWDGAAGLWRFHDGETRAPPAKKPRVEAAQPSIERASGKRPTAAVDRFVSASSFAAAKPRPSASPGGAEKKHVAKTKKRGPGRPKGSGVAGAAVLLADATVAQLRAELKKREGKKKRGRPKKAKATTDGASGTDQDDQEYDVKEITGKRTHEGGVQYLVRWKGFDDSDEDTWEPLDSLGSAQQAIERFENAKPNAKAAAAAIGTKANPPREAPPPRVAASVLMKRPAGRPPVGKVWNGEEGQYEYIRQ